MQTKFLARSLLALGSAAALWAAPVTSSTPVHTQPDGASPAMSFLKPGTEPVSVPNAKAPAGWMAVELPGPFEGYVETKDITKSMDVKPGAPIRLAPKADAGVLALADKGDKTSILGSRGKWMQISLEKKLVGYIKVAAPPPVATTPPPTPAPITPPPVSPGVYGVASAGQAAPMVNLGDGGSSTLPRQYAGRFVSTRRPFTPRRPYDYGLADDAGKRFAYLDVSRLLQTEQIEKYVDRPVVVYGAARATVDGRDIVIVVETLQLR